MNRRVKKKGKRKIKTWVKLTILGLIIALLGGLLGYAWYQQKINAEDPTGMIIEEHGEIATLEGEDESPSQFSYTVLDTASESIFVECNGIEVLIGPDAESIEKVKDKIKDGLDYLVVTDNNVPSDLGISVKNVVGASINGVNSLNANETIILGDRFSLATISTQNGMATYIIYKDCGFVSLGNLSSDDEYELIPSIANADVVVAAQNGKSDNNRIIKEKKPRYVAVSQKDIYSLGDDIYVSAENIPIYATGHTGDLLFTTNGSVVTSSFDAGSSISPDVLEKLKEAESSENTEEEVSKDGENDN